MFSCSRSSIVRNVRCKFKMSGVISQPGNQTFAVLYWAADHSFSSTDVDYCWPTYTHVITIYFIYFFAFASDRRRRLRMSTGRNAFCLPVSCRISWGSTFPTNRNTSTRANSSDLRWTGEHPFLPFCFLTVVAKLGKTSSAGSQRKRRALLHERRVWRAGFVYNACCSYPLCRFLGGKNANEMFCNRDRQRIAYEILARTVYGDKSRAEIGIDRLLDEGIYAAAYPLHDVWNLNVKIFTVAEWALIAAAGLHSADRHSVYSGRQ